MGYNVMILYMYKSCNDQIQVYHLTYLLFLYGESFQSLQLFWSVKFIIAKYSLPSVQQITFTYSSCFLAMPFRNAEKNHCNGSLRRQETIPGMWGRGLATQQVLHTTLINQWMKQIWDVREEGTKGIGVNQIRHSSHTWASCTSLQLSCRIQSPCLCNPGVDLYLLCSFYIALINHLGSFKKY